MSVYVAGSSDELDRARRVMDRYRAAGVEVTSTWVEKITAVGAANPRHASREQRAGYAYPCIDQVRAADILHWLTPSVGHGRGSYWEAACAWVWSKGIIASGDTKQSIFPSLVRELATDDEAIAQVIAAHERAGKIIPGTPIDTWGKVIVRSPDARPNPPVRVATAAVNADPGAYVTVGCGCDECVIARANAAALGYGTPPAPAHVEPERSTAMRVATDEGGGDAE